MTLLITAGDNPERLSNERSFAALLGSSPIPVNSGQKQGRYRLNRGGDRDGNSALWRIAIVRMATDPDTRAYVERRMQDGKTKSEAIRCLKRYIAREVFAAPENRRRLTVGAALLRAVRGSTMHPMNQRWPLPVFAFLTLVTLAGVFLQGLGAGRGSIVVGAIGAAVTAFQTGVLFEKRQQAGASRGA